jgi:hypothetical protein
MIEPSIQTMHDFLRYHISITPTHRLVLELEDINKNKLRDEELLECKELRDYYIQRQGYIIEHLREMFDKDAEI